MSNSTSNMDVDNNPTIQTVLPQHHGELMGAPRPYGGRTDYSPKAFLKAMKRRWSLNPAFFINDDIKISYTISRLFGPAEI